jgi:hypothetical protein
VVLIEGTMHEMNRLLVSFYVGVMEMMTAKIEIRYYSYSNIALVCYGSAVQDVRYLERFY